MSVLRAKAVSVTLGGNRVLAPTECTFSTGELTAIVGPNGAGKSTLLRALLGLQAHQGKVELDEALVDTLPPKERAKRLAYLPQGQRHAWPLPVEDVVALGRYPHGGQDYGTVKRLLETLDLTDMTQRPVTQLSGGEQMRVSLARALAVDADFLLADEPLASLDPHHQYSLMEVLAAACRHGAGVVIVVHDLAIAAQYADRVLILKRGHWWRMGHPGPDSPMRSAPGHSGSRRRPKQLAGGLGL